ncbi:MAG: Smr/MutS family protein [Pseudomonadota bacterium]
MNDDDIQLFLHAIGATRGEVRRLPQHGKALHATRHPQPRLRPRAKALVEKLSGNLPYFSDHDPYAPLTDRRPDEADASAYANSEFHRPSIASQTLRRLKQGKLRIEHSLDLHGCAVEEARVRVAWLLQQPDSGRYLGEALCVRIVHGQGYNSPQGQGKLKRLLAIWLPQSERVLAFCAARPQDGGQGAMYVLLRSTP